jgi:DNA-binding XRE family transcriptional regulator
MQRLTTKEKKEIGWRIKEIRERDLEMTQAEFAEKLGTIQTTISRVEKGRALPTIELLIAISGLSGKTIDWILKNRH